MTVLAVERAAAQVARNPLPVELVARLFERISEISTLPTAAQQIIMLADDPRTAADDLLDAVRSDPALAMRVMRTVNSSAFGLANPVGDLKQAITLLGFEELRNLALTAFVAPLFVSSGPREHYSRSGLWQHMVSSALVARQIARITRRVPSQEAYLAALLHDVGYILLDQYLHEPFCRVIDALNGATPTWQVELRLLGFDHAALGGFVAAKWNLPQRHATAIGCHHLPEACDGDEHALACVVAAADFFCHVKETTSLGIRGVGALGNDTLAPLGLTKGNLDSLLEQIDNLLTVARGMAVIQTR